MAATAPLTLGPMCGPVYLLESLATIWHVDPLAIEAMASGRLLIVLTTSDGHRVVPVSQLDDELRPLPLGPILRVLDRDVVDDWMLTSWLIAPHDLLDGSSVVDYLRDGGDVEQAVAVASAARSRWSA